MVIQETGQLPCSDGSKIQVKQIQGDGGDRWEFIVTGLTAEDGCQFSVGSDTASVLAVVLTGRGMAWPGTSMHLAALPPLPTPPPPPTAA